MEAASNEVVVQLGQLSHVTTIHENWKNEIESLTDFDNRLLWLTQNLTVLNQKGIEYGEQAYQELQHKNLTPEELYQLYSITFDWAEWCKLYVLLLRDTLFEQQKAILFQKDGITTEGDLKQLWEDSDVMFKKALASMNTKVVFWDKEALQTKVINKRKHQENPWPVFKNQLEGIEEQFHFLKKDFENLSSIQVIMHQIKTLVQGIVATCLNEIKECESKINKVVQLMNSSEFLETPKSIFSKLHKITEDIKTEEPLDVFKGQTEALLKDYSSVISPIIAIKGGIVQQRDFAPQKNINQWLESEIYPLLYEMWEVTESGVVGLRMVLVNLTNRMEILHKENQETELKNQGNLLQSVYDFRKNLVYSSSSLAETEVQLNERLEREFKLVYLFDESQYFLPVSLQSTFNEKFWNNENSIFAQGRLLLTKVVTKLQKIKDDAYKEQTFSTSEKIADCIRERQPSETSNNYASIFLTKGYVGESFFVGRKQELERVNKLIHNWNNGFRGAVLLTGNRFSGKTIFSEIVAQRNFAHNYYRLLPEYILDVQGRKMHTTFDLEAALDFICKYNPNEKPLILIDDLELWWSPEVPFYQNIQHLAACIDLYSNRFFFVVTANSKIKEQLYCFTHFDRIFQAEINLDIVTYKTLQEAVAIRHGATHKTLVNVDGEELTAAAFNKLVNAIHTTASGNIGDALSTWANSTIPIDEKLVQNSFEGYKKLPTFLNKDSSLIIKTILLQKRVNEYRLRQLLGPAFNTRYATVVRRLIHVGVLQRQLDGFIELEPVIANDVKKMLNFKK